MSHDSYYRWLAALENAPQTSLNWLEATRRPNAGWCERFIHPSKHYAAAAALTEASLVMRTEGAESIDRGLRVTVEYRITEAGRAELARLRQAYARKARRYQSGGPG